MVTEVSGPTVRTSMGLLGEVSKAHSRPGTRSWIACAAARGRGTRIEVCFPCLSKGTANPTRSA